MVATTLRRKRLVGFEPDPTRIHEGGPAGPKMARHAREEKYANMMRVDKPRSAASASLT